ncbi:MAG TPA: hypothetical protein VGN90_04920 [Pyrinomonadaceae bacterium]|jgi:hypothetical protein|nr:hypothetical protein [Pyrinomonadaceae bacterium]
MQILLTTKALARAGWVALLLAFGAGLASAQSTDIAWPTPVRTNEVSATIPARDLGDPRVTDHFYAFSVTPGDVLITVDSRNLNGDIDVFTLAGLRPLLKFTVYAGSSSLITKSLYLRTSEDLILRVEGRTPNDDDAVYRIRFGGSFQSITSGPLVEHDDAAQAQAAAAGDQKGRRVSSVGARIDEPPVEVAAVPTPEPTPDELSITESKAAPKPTARKNRPGRPVPRKTRPTAAPKADETAKVENENKSSDETSEPETPTPTKRPAKRNRPARAAAKPVPVQEPEDSGPRLVIETSDGTFVDRYMNSVRRVTIENGQVVVVGRDGKIQRIPLASVVRMTISP